MRFHPILILAITGAIFLSSWPQPTFSQGMAVQSVDCGDVLSAPGKYKLNSDLFCMTSTAAIQITSSDVHLDLNGYSVTCDGAVPGIPVGILAIDVNNVFITDGQISNCATGIVLTRVQESKVTKMTLTEIGSDILGFLANGILLTETNDSEIVRNKVNDNDVSGIVLVASNRNKISDNETNNNQRSGITAAFGGSNDNKVVGNESNGNGIAGIAVGGPGSRNVVRGNVANGNLGRGIVLFGFETAEGVITSPIASGNNVQGNTALGNAEWDLLEAAVELDLVNFVFEIVRIADGCANTWKSNDFVSQRGPQDCIY